MKKNLFCPKVHKVLNNKGFSLLEIMIVIGIIVILAGTSIVLFNPSERQKEQRDALRVSNLVQIASAMELYYSERKIYPSDLSELQDLNISVSLDDPLGPDFADCAPVIISDGLGSYYEIYAIKESKNFKIPAGQSAISEVTEDELPLESSLPTCLLANESSESFNEKMYFKISGGKAPEVAPTDTTTP